MAEILEGWAYARARDEMAHERHDQSDPMQQWVYTVVNHLREKR